MKTEDRISLLLRKNGFTFDADGSINYPRGGNHYFLQNMILSLYINNALDRKGSKYVIRTTADVLTPVAA